MPAEQQAVVTMTRADWERLRALARQSPQQTVSRWIRQAVNERLDRQQQPRLAALAKTPRPIERAS